VFLALHVLTAVLDTYVDVGWLALIVPFASPFRPLWTGLGTVGVDLMAAVAVSSALRQRISPRTWRGIHWLAYGSWPVAMAHTFGMGTDAATVWLDAVGALCTVALVAALVWRIADHRRNRRLAGRVGATTRAVPPRSLLSPGHPSPGPSGSDRVAPTGSAVRLLERD